jgi:hypothetical protein
MVLGVVLRVSRTLHVSSFSFSLLSLEPFRNVKNNSKKDVVNECTLRERAAFFLCSSPLFFFFPVHIALKIKAKEESDNEENTEEVAFSYHLALAVFFFFTFFCSAFPFV